MSRTLRDLKRPKDDLCAFGDNCLTCGLYIASCEPPCTWTEDEDGYWNTECGNLIVLNTGTPRDNGFVYCPYCGQRLIERPYNADHPAPGR